jgi:hypothetical protein
MQMIKRWNTAPIVATIEDALNTGTEKTPEELRETLMKPCGCRVIINHTLFVNVPVIFNL